MSYRSKDYGYYNPLHLRCSSTVTRKAKKECCEVGTKEPISVSQRVGELQERTEQIQKELSRLSEQFHKEQVQSKLKREELEERTRRQREEDQRRASERRQRQQERILQKWEEWERERQRTQQQRRVGRQAQLQAAEERVGVQRRRRPTPPNFSAIPGLGAAGRRTSPRDARGSPRDPPNRRSPRDLSASGNLRMERRNSPRDAPLASTRENIVYITHLEQVREEGTTEAEEANKSDSSSEEDDNEDIARWMLPTEQELKEMPSQYCPILCRETNNYVATLCGHYFDREAITTWMSQPDSPESCPVCRKPFKLLDKKAQRKVAHKLVVLYLNYVSGQYRRLWESDRHKILAKFWDAIDGANIENLLELHKSGSGVNICVELQCLLTRPVDAYVARLKQAVHDIIIKDIRTNLKSHIPACYQSQLDREKTIYFAYSLTQLVPDYHAKWWQSTYLPMVYSVMEELFLKKFSEA